MTSGPPDHWDLPPVADLLSPGVARALRRIVLAEGRRQGYLETVAPISIQSVQLDLSDNAGVGQ